MNIITDLDMIVLDDWIHSEDYPAYHPLQARLGSTIHGIFWGNEDYHECPTCGHRSHNDYTNSRVLLSAQPQSGKTDVMIRVIYEAIQRWSEVGDDPSELGTWQIIIFSCIADNSLKEQTEDRIRDAFPPDVWERLSRHQSIIVEHAQSVNEEWLARTKDSNIKRLIILDESHLNKNRNPSGEMTKMLDLLDALGVALDRPCAEWNCDESQVKLLEVSATPFAEQLLDRSIEGEINQELDKDTLREVLMEPSDGYCGVRKIEADGRFRERPNFISGSGKNSTILPNLWKVIHDAYADEVKKNGDGYCVIRVSSTEQAEVLKEWIETNTASDKPLVKVFSSNKNHEPIGALMDYVKDTERAGTRHTRLWRSAHGMRCYLLIIGSYRAGKTFTGEMTRNIRCWVDGASTQHDTVIQSVGRCFGYDKGADSFPIFCDYEKIKGYIQFLDSKVPTLSGNGVNLRGVRTRRSQYKIIGWHPIEKSVYDQEYKNKPKKILDLMGQALPKDIVLPFNQFSLAVNSRKGTPTNPVDHKNTYSRWVASNQFRGSYRENSTSKKGDLAKFIARIVYLDKPCPNVDGGVDHAWGEIQQTPSRILLGRVCIPILQLQDVADPSVVTAGHKPLSVYNGIDGSESAFAFPDES